MKQIGARTRKRLSHVDTYADRALSGASSRRPDYLKLLEDARQRRFGMVVAEGLDRLSRDQEDIAGFYKELTFVITEGRAARGAG